MEDQTILVVDGEIDSRHHAVRILRDAGYEVYGTGTAEEALSLMRKHSVSSILLDLALNETDSSRLIRTISGKFPDAEIILTTRQHQPPSEYRRLEVNDYLEKAIDITSLSPPP